MFRILLQDHLYMSELTGRASGYISSIRELYMLKLVSFHTGRYLCSEVDWTHARQTFMWNKLARHL